MHFGNILKILQIYVSDCKQRIFTKNHKISQKKIILAQKKKFDIINMLFNISMKQGSSDGLQICYFRFYPLSISYYFVGYRNAEKNQLGSKICWVNQWMNWTNNEIQFALFISTTFNSICEA